LKQFTPCRGGKDYGFPSAIDQKNVLINASEFNFDKDTTSVQNVDDDQGQDDLDKLRKNTKKIQLLRQ